MAGCLIIHGYTGGPFELQPLIDYLQNHFDWDVEVPLLPGHGESLVMEDMLHDKWVIASEEALKRLLASNNEVYVIGFSMGGMIASYLASKYRISKLVLLAPSRRFLSLRQISRDVWSMIFDGVTGRIGDNEVYAHYSQKVGKVPLRANLEFLRLVRMTRDSVRNIKTPVLIAQGRQDNMVPYQTAYHLDREIPSESKEIILFDNSRHRLCLGDDKDTLNQIVGDFLHNKK